MFQPFVTGVVVVVLVALLASQLRQPSVRLLPSAAIAVASSLPAVVAVLAVVQLAALAYSSQG